MTSPEFTLNDGHTMPVIGFGTYPLRGDPGYAAVRAALNNGFRLLDTAVHYHNEVEVGRAVREFLDGTVIPRDELTIQTKIANQHHAYDAVMLACQDSRELLGLDRIDVLLLHTPKPQTDEYREGWRALVDLQRSGVVHSVGVSNFSAPQLATIIEDSGVTPAIHQIEMHPYSAQPEMRAEHARLGILTQSWSPLGGENSAFFEPAVADPAATHHVTPAQVVLRWQLQQGIVPLPTSATVAQQRELLDVFGFELTEPEVAAISALTRPSEGLSGA